jgi:hypothetical protein
MKKIISLVICLAIILSLVISTPAFAANQSGTVWLNLGESYTLDYTTTKNIDLTVSIWDNDGLLDDIADVYVNNRFLMETDPSVTSTQTISLYPGTYQIKLSCAGTLQIPGGEFGYSLTEAKFTGKFVPLWLKVAATQKIPMYTFGDVTQPRLGCFATFITNQGDNALTISVTVKEALPKIKYDALLVVDGTSYSMGSITTDSNGNYGGQNQQRSFTKILSRGMHQVDFALLHQTDPIDTIATDIYNLVIVVISSQNSQR